MTIQSNITTEDPITTIQVRKVQLKNEVSDRGLWDLDPITYYLVLIPTYVFADQIAATETVVPKSARDSMVFPFHDTTLPRVQAA